MQEEWKVINGDDRYQISNYGRVKMYDDITYGTPDTTGYLKVYMLSKTYYIHRLVANYFIPKPESESRLEVNHRDGNRNNNRLDNLEWCTKSQNIKHSVEIGTHHPKPKFNREQIIEIKTMLKNKIPHHEIAKIYNVTRPCISLIATGKRYANITLND